MSYALTRAGVVTPTRLLGRVPLQPFLQLLRRHVHGGIEVPMIPISSSEKSSDGRVLDDIFLAFDHIGSAGVERPGFTL